ncbi:hypothetical protein LY78DRAFT_98924 [Colletotrichum sublineola]|nr:hypothetical protein LY78DRAFT_98924 [Colletotrichum sublineola]
MMPPTANHAQHARPPRSPRIVPSLHPSGGRRPPAMVKTETPATVLPQFRNCELACSTTLLWRPRPFLSLRSFCHAAFQSTGDPVPLQRHRAMERQYLVCFIWTTTKEHLIKCTFYPYHKCDGSVAALRGSLLPRCPTYTNARVASTRMDAQAVVPLSRAVYEAGRCSINLNRMPTLENAPVHSCLVHAHHLAHPPLSIYTHLHAHTYMHPYARENAPSARESAPRRI